MPQRTIPKNPGREYYTRLDGDLDEKAFNSDIFVQKFWQRTKIDNILKFMGAGELVLDVGSGSGVISKFISEKNSVVSLDISEKCIRNCRKLGLKDGVVADAIKLPFKDGTFDRIVCVELIEHLDEPQRCISEFRRVLKDDGRLILTTPNYRSLWPVTEWLWDRFGRGRDYRKQHIYKFNPSSIKKLLEDSGFHITSEKTVFLFSPFFALFSKYLTDRATDFENMLLGVADIGMLITITCRKRG